jgi:hypothetical protein
MRELKEQLDAVIDKILSYRPKESKKSESEWQDCGCNKCRRHTNRVDQSYCLVCSKFLRQL